VFLAIPATLPPAVGPFFMMLYTGGMGFFDELGSLIGEVTSIGDDIKQTADDTIASVTESAEEITAIKNELLQDINPTDQN
jgi:hypothetical protein